MGKPPVYGGGNVNSLPLNIDTIASRVVVLEREMKDIKAEIQEYAVRIENMERGHDVVESELTGIRGLCAEIKEDVKELKEKPMRKFDSISTYVIQWLIVAILGAVLIFK